MRKVMREESITAYLVPSSDPHQSEYVPSRWQRRAWLSGFSGSAGEVLVVLRGAGLWTDGRYHLQAENELGGSGIRLFRAGQPDVPSIEQHLGQSLAKGDVLGVDPKVVSASRAQSLKAAVEGAGGEFRFIERNLVDAIWSTQPPMARGEVTVWPDRFAGETVQAKLRRVRRAMSKRGADAHLITALDAIAWLFNIRGTDVGYNPVAIAYALVTHDGAELFIDAAKVPAAVRRALKGSVLFRPYGHIRPACRALSRTHRRVWVDPDTTNAWCVAALGESAGVRAPSPIGRMKAKKNSVELAGMRAAHHRDGVAMVRFLSWLDQAVAEGGETELSAAAQLEAFRSTG